MIISPTSIRRILTAHPDLCSNGFRFTQWGKSVPDTDKEFDKMRDDLLKDFRIAEIKTAVEFIRHFPIEHQEPVDSYALKHRIERWGRTVDMAGYVCNGSAIVAAILCGYKLHKRNGPNCQFRRAKTGPKNSACTKQFHP